MNTPFRHAISTICSLPLALLVMAGISSCTALVERESIQCRKDSDCQRSGQFEDTVCHAGGVCGPDYCSTHSQCNDKLGIASGGYCNPTTSLCANVNRSGCQLYPKSPADGAILFGFMGPLEGDYASYGAPLLRGAQVAIAEINSLTSQQFAVLACNDAGQKDTGSKQLHEQVASYLANEVKVPAVLGPAFSGASRNAFPVLAKAQTLAMSASATSPEFASDPIYNDLFWRTVPADDRQAPAMVKLLESAAAELARQKGVPSYEPRVLTVYLGNQWGRGIFREVSDLLASESKPDAVQYAETIKTEAEWQAAANNVIEKNPEVILVLGQAEFVGTLLPLIDKGLDHKVLYIIPESGRLDELLGTLATDPSHTLAARILGTAPGARTSRGYFNFASTYESEFGDVGNLAEFAYDALYLLAYASARVGSTYDITGPNLAGALREFTCKSKPTALRPGATVASGMRLAQSEACVDFEGASGPVDFDANGEVDLNSSDMLVWCPQIDGRELTLERYGEVYFRGMDRTLRQGDQTLKKPLTFCPPISQAP